jgi:hypothetical protein
MGNFRDSLKKAFNEGFSVSDLYGADKYSPVILKEIDPNKGDEEPKPVDDEDLGDPIPDDPEMKNDPSMDPPDDPEDVTSDDTDTSDDKSKDSTDEPKKRPEPEEITPPEPITPVETPDQKVTRLYTDTGDVDVDYSITSESNIRLAKFKFDNAGIVLDKVLSEDDLKGGISVKDIENRLTPAQTDLYKEKNRELRKKYPLIDKREKMILIHNAKVPMTKRDEKYNEVKVDNDQRKQAYEKLNAYMMDHFSPSWQDKTKYVDFLKTIKVNFSDKPAIRANLINAKTFISEDDENIIPLDKVYSQIPKSVQELILDNNEDENFVKSNIFRTLNSAFSQEVGSSGSLYVIINSENIKLGDGNDTEEKEPDDSKDDTSDDSDIEKPDTPDEEGSEETSPETEPSGEAELDPVGTDVEI